MVQFGFRFFGPLGYKTHLKSEIQESSNLKGSKVRNVQNIFK